MSFKNLDLNPGLLKAISRLGFKEATAIQSKSIPVILSGEDLMASAQTGTGKTAAFSLPVIQKLITTKRSKGKGPRVLVLTPTRELAMQVKDCVTQFSNWTNLRTGLLVGGMGYGPQLKMLKRGVDIVVATPGRLKDHMENGAINFKNLEVLILDEADRMLDMGFIGDIREIAAATPDTRQTLLFSATLEGPVLKIASELLRKPTRISLASNSQRHRSIDQRAHLADTPEHKFKLLVHHLSHGKVNQAVIFTKTKRGAEKLCSKLSALNFKSTALHGDMHQGKRKRTIDLIKKGKFQILVATDVAARGLDIDGISHVFNYDIPMVAEDYIHRIGRTGRAGAEGVAISLVGKEDRKNLQDIERLIKRNIQFEIVPGLEPKQTAKIIRFPDKNNRKPSQDKKGKKQTKARRSNKNKPKAKHKAKTNTKAKSKVQSRQNKRPKRMAG